MKRIVIVAFLLTLFLNASAQADNGLVYRGYSSGTRRTTVYRPAPVYRRKTSNRVYYPQRIYQRPYNYNRGSSYNNRGSYNNYPSYNGYRKTQPRGTSYPGNQYRGNKLPRVRISIG